jgi:hypothetical protein
MNEDDLPVTDDQQPSEDDIKEVFAYFGSAYYYSECLHGELCNAYAIIALKDQGYIIRPRFEEMIAKAFSLTLGKLIAELIPHMPEELGRRMKAVLEQRNFLAHHFWYERCHLMTSIDGISQLLSELYQMREQFDAMDKEAHSLFEPLHRAAGITEALENEALQAIMRGEDHEPLPSKRLPRRKERIVGVYVSVH